MDQLGQWINSDNGNRALDAGQRRCPRQPSVPACEHVKFFANHYPLPRRKAGAHSSVARTVGRFQKALELPDARIVRKNGSRLFAGKPMSNLLPQLSPIPDFFTRSFAGEPTNDLPPS